MTGLFRDSIIAARTLLKARAFTAVCVTSLGLGMAVVIGMLLLMRMLLSAPPGLKEDGLVELVIRPSGALRAQAGGDVIDTWSYADYLDLRAAVFEKRSRVRARRCGPLCHDNDRAGVSCREDARRRRRAKPAIEDDPDERSLSIDASRRQERIITENRADPDANRVDFRPHVMRMSIRCC